MYELWTILIPWILLASIAFLCQPEFPSHSDPLSNQWSASTEKNKQTNNQNQKNPKQLIVLYLIIFSNLGSRIIQSLIIWFPTHSNWMRKKILFSEVQRRVQRLR